MKYSIAPVVQRLIPAMGHDHKIYEEPPGGSLLVEQIRHGLPMAEFRALIELLDVPEEDLGRLVGISPATLHRRKKSRRLAMPESERIVRFARLFGLAMEVFGSQEAAREWLKMPNPGTAGETPLSYADTEFGAREVENLLGRLDHGVF
jgi:putative toxin-antitoxin system antitoxin component (TIGR02293 family)